jgi:hypothetical protein
MVFGIYADAEESARVMAISVRQAEMMDDLIQHVGGVGSGQYNSG